MPLRIITADFDPGGSLFAALEGSVTEEAVLEDEFFSACGESASAVFGRKLLDLIEERDGPMTILIEVR